MASDRSAVSAISGYFYQFDATIILCLALAKDSDYIDVECVEDVDITTASETTAVQCKYYEGTEYNHSIIKKAVRFMLEDFALRKDAGLPSLRYHIRGHFNKGADKLPAKLGVDFLKRHLLSYKRKGVPHEPHTRLGLNESILEEFLAVLTFDLKAPSFDKQFAQLLASLRIAFNCTESLAENFYYNNALRLIRDLATNPDSAQRRISKKQFIKRVDTAKSCFDEWLALFRGKEKFLAALRRRHFTELNIGPAHRFFLIEVPEDADLTTLAAVTRLIAKKWSRINRREPHPFCPYVYFEKLPTDKLIMLKKELNHESFRIADGHAFQGADFDVESIKTQPTDANGIKIKILNDIGALRETMTATARNRVVYQFYLTEEFCSFEAPSVSHVKIKIDGITDIKEIV